jgi:quinol monooxygenase YgiN
MVPAAALSGHSSQGIASIGRVVYAIGMPRAVLLAVVRLTLTLTAPPGESWRLADGLRSLMIPTHRERGCLSCQLQLSTASSDPSRIQYVEAWSSEEDLREQLRSDRFMRVLSVMEQASGPPEIRFDLAGRVRGLDYVEEVRSTR